MSDPFALTVPMSYGCCIRHLLLFLKPELTTEFFEDRWPQLGLRA